jgi:hypothetical protein
MDIVKIRSIIDTSGDFDDLLGVLFADSVRFEVFGGEDAGLAAEVVGGGKFMDGGVGCGGGVKAEEVVQC